MNNGYTETQTYSFSSGLVRVRVMALARDVWVWTANIRGLNIENMCRGRWDSREECFAAAAKWAGRVCDSMAEVGDAIQRGDVD
jgi:hypothetical protein